MSDTQNTRNSTQWSTRHKSQQPSGGLSGNLDISVTKFLREHVLFKDVTDQQFIERLASSLQIRVYTDRDTIIKKGEVGRAMFFILKGQVEVVSEDGKLLFYIFIDSIESI
jgi:signal-transduction protein with cAMP-binding, CBS, and nucleotidyltransferase domain